MKKSTILLLSIFAYSAIFAEFDVSNSAKENIAKIGETIEFSAADIPKDARFELKQNGKRVSSGQYSEPVKFTAEVPAWLEFKVFAPKIKEGEKKREEKACGVVVAPEKLKPATTAPKDLDKFWNAYKKEVEKQSPKKAKLTKIRDFNADKSPYGAELYRFEVKVDNAEYGSIGGVVADGYIAIPIGKEEKMPIVATFYGAGSYSADLRDAVNFAKEGAIGISMNPHAISPDLKDEARKEYIDNKVHLDGGKIPYRNRGITETPQDVYFTGMFKRVYQTLRLAMSRPEWDKRNIAVRGFSQGGAQTIVAAYLCPKVNVITPLCPAMCDNGGESIKRRSGWPDWVHNETMTTQLENGRYFDPALMASKIKAKMYVGIGLIDNTCSPTAVTSMFNNYAGKKQKLYMQGVGHGWNDEWSKTEKDFILTNIGLKK